MRYEIRDYQDERLYKGECFYCARFDHDSSECENNPKNIKGNDNERRISKTRATGGNTGNNN